MRGSGVRLSSVALDEISKKGYVIITINCRRTPSNKIGLSKEVDRLNKMYKPNIEEWIEELKRLFPFTYQDKIKWVKKVYSKYSNNK